MLTESTQSENMTQKKRPFGERGSCTSRNRKKQKSVHQERKANEKQLVFNNFLAYMYEFSTAHTKRARAYLKLFIFTTGNSQCLQNSSLARRRRQWVISMTKNNVQNSHPLSILGERRSVGASDCLLHSQSISLSLETKQKKKQKAEVARRITANSSLFALVLLSSTGAALAWMNPPDWMVRMPPESETCRGSQQNILRSRERGSIEIRQSTWCTWEVEVW